MSAPSLSLVIDITDPQKQGLKQSFNSGVRSVLPVVFRDDGTQTQIRFVQPSSTSYRPWDDVDVSSAVVQVGVGLADKSPTSGGMNMTWDADTTSTPVKYNDSAATVSTKLNALASIVSAGGVTVTSTSLGWLIEFVTNGARDLFTAATVDLFPASSIIIYRAQPGTASEPEIQQVILVQQAAAYQDSWSALPGPGATVTVIQAGGSSVNAQWSIALAPAPYDGAWIITVPEGTTSQIPYGATAAQVQTALQAIGTNGNTNYVVSGNPGLYYVTNTTGTNITTFSVNSSGLIVPKGVLGEIDFNSAALYNLFQAADPTSSSITLLFEIALTFPSVPKQTVFQIPCQVFRDVLQSGQVALANVPTAYTEAEADNTFVHNIPGLTGLTGGGSSNFDGAVSTVTRTLGQMFVAEIAGILYGWQLEAGTTATSAPYIIRPADYNASTNQKVWALVSLQSSSPTAPYLNYIGRLTGLSGGGSTNLDGVATAGGAVVKDTIAEFLNAGIPTRWYLDTGTDATADGVQRPADYNASTNAVVWRRLN